MKIYGEGEFLVTFAPADISIAHSPDQMFSLAKINKSFSMLRANTVDEFISKGEYHKSRGDFVFKTVQNHHDACRDILMSYLDEDSLISSIPISNTFLVKAKKSQIRGLATVSDFSLLLDSTIL